MELPNQLRVVAPAARCAMNLPFEPVLTMTDYYDGRVLASRTTKADPISTSRNGSSKSYGWTELEVQWHVVSGGG